MKISDEWPDRIYIDASQYDKIHELSSKVGSDSRDSCFKSLKEALLAAAVIGYNLGQYHELESKKEIIYTRYLDSQLDIPIVVSLAIVNKENVDMIDDKRQILEIFQCYVKGGFEVLYDIVKATPDEVLGYADYLLRNHVKG